MPRVVKQNAIMNAVRVESSVEVATSEGELLFAQEGDWIIYDNENKVKAILEDYEYRDKWIALGI